MASLTRDQAANALQLFEAQENAARNLLSSGFTGPNPAAAEGGRSLYLGWHADAERFLREAGGLQPELDALDTRRHRDLVNNLVALDQMYREVESEVERVRLVLRPAAERLGQLLRATATDSSIPESALQHFTSDHGREYTYDPSDTLGHGSALTQVFRGADAEGHAMAVKRVRIRLDNTRRRKEEPRLAEREIEIARQLWETRGEYLVPVEDYAHRDGELLLVMPLADYSLADRIADGGPLSSDEVRDLLLDMAQALQELALAAVLHRDITPRNILWYRGHWCLADFNISRLLSVSTASVSWTGSGTPEYMAPELRDGKPATQLSDAYALGLTALEALTGERALSGEDLRQAQARFSPSFPEGCDPLVRRSIAELLHHDPGGRPSDARRITELLKPAGTLSEAQRSLQSLRASQVERDLERGALVVQAQEHSVLQRQARISFAGLWQGIADSATQAVHDAMVIEDGDVVALALGDAELRVRLSGASMSAGPIVMVAELYVERAGQSRIVGNLYCTGDGGVPRWRLVQFEYPDAGEKTGHRALDLAAMLQSGDDFLSEAVGKMSTEASADTLLGLFVREAANRDIGRPSDSIDEVQRLVDEQDAAEAREADRIVEALGTEVSFVTVASALAVANGLRALNAGRVTIRASLEARIDISFSWRRHQPDGRFSEPGGSHLTVKAHVDAEPGGMTPAIETNWRPTEAPEVVSRRINAMLIERDRWNGAGTIDWGQVFRELHRAIELAVAYKRRDPTTSWRLHGALYELHGRNWAITEAGIEHRPSGTVVLAEQAFPDHDERDRGLTSTGLGGWEPAPPEGTDTTEWQHLLWRGLWHFPVQRGPVFGQATWWPDSSLPSQTTMEA